MDIQKWFEKITKKGWHLTTEHSQSSYGIPVLVSPSGEVFGEGDFIPEFQIFAHQLIGAFPKYFGELGEKFLGKYNDDCPIAGAM